MGKKEWVRRTGWEFGQSDGYFETKHKALRLHVATK
jgi:hypothetical protein